MEINPQFRYEFIDTISHFIQYFLDYLLKCQETIKNKFHIDNY